MKIRKNVLLNIQEDEIVKERAKLDGETWNAALRAIIRESARLAPTNGKVITIGGASQPEI